MWLDDLQTTLEARISKGATLVVAVSGGGDSVALLHGVYRCRAAVNLRLVVAHLDHALRPDSGADAAFVTALASRLGLMSIRERVDVGAQAASEGRNLEETARNVRYTFLDAVAKAVGASAIVTAHTRDDQAETLLMRLLRGAGLEGLAGMSMLTTLPQLSEGIALLRPLLHIDRETLRAWMRAEGHTWREDNTNADTTRFRSAIRHDVLPFLNNIAPRLSERLAETAALLRQDAELLHALTEESWQRVALRRGNRIHIGRNAFLAEPPSLQRRLIRRAYDSVNASEQQLSAEHITESLRLIERGEIRQELTLPGGILLTLAQDGVWMGAPVTDESWEAVELSLTQPTRAAGFTFLADIVTADALPEAWRDHPAHIAFFALDAVALPLTVRPPRPAERWQPLGMDGQSVELRTWFAKQKVPHHRWEHLPLLVDAEGRILWVVGWRNAHIGRVTPSDSRFLRVEATANDA